MANQGFITKQQAKDATRLYNKRMQGKKVDAFTAQLRLVEDLQKLSRKSLNHATRVAISQKRIEGYIAKTLNMRGMSDPVLIASDIMEHMGTQPYQDVMGLQRSYSGHYQGMLDEFLNEYKKGYFTGDKRRDNVDLLQGLDNFAKERFKPGSSGDAKAKKFAEDFEKVAEELRVRFNQEGGQIPKRKDWGLPASHDALLIRNAGRQPWIDRTMPLLDADRMVDTGTGLKMTEPELRDYLGKVWDHIDSDGWTTREPGEFGSMTALYKDHADPRMLHFKDHAAWTEYNKDFGIRDVYGTVTEYVQTMSRDIALMEVLGPNPRRMYQWLQDTLRKSYAEKKVKAGGMEGRAWDMQENMTRFDSISQDATNKTRFKKIGQDIIDLHKELDKTRQLRYRDIFKSKSRRRLSTGEYGEALKAERASLLKKIDALEVQARKLIDDKRLGPALAGKVRNQLDNAFYDLRRFEDLPIAQAKHGETMIGLKLKQGQAMFDIASETMDPNRLRGLALWSGTVRNIITASSLGSASISATTDHAYSLMARSHNGMRVMKHFSDFYKNFNPANRAEMVKAEMILDNAIRAAQIEARNGATIATNTRSGYAADRVIGVSGLAGLTQVAKHAFAWEFQSHMAEQVAKRWEDLSPEVASLFRRHNITKSDFGKMGKVQTHGYGSARFLRPNEMRKAHPDLAHKYHSMITRERFYAVPEATLRTKAITTGGGKAAGTTTGELARHGFLFRSFSITVGMMQVERILRTAFERGSFNAAKYAAGVLMTTTVLGYMALQMKELKKGKEPQPFSASMLWASVMQGGGLGIVGDLFQTGFIEDRFGSGPLESILGPSASRAGGFMRGAHNILTEGDPSKFIKESMRSIPGSNIWATQLMWERAVVDNLNYLMAGEEKHKKSWKRWAKKQKSGFGNEYWLAPTHSGL
jgi:hypothetical protein